MVPPTFVPTTWHVQPSLRRPVLSPARHVFHRPVRPVRRARVQMIGPFFPDFGNSKLMKSEIVRKEMGNLERDYAELTKLGTSYEKFDREGKVIFIEQALDVVDRFSILLTRLKLSDEFSAQMFIKQYQLKLSEYGLTIDSLVANTKKSLEMMRSEVEQQSA